MIRSSLVVFSLVVSIVPYWLLLFYSGSMDHLHRYGVSINLPKNEFVDMLSSHHPDDLDKLRQSLFQELSSKDLIQMNLRASPSSPVVTRLPDLVLRSLATIVGSSWTVFPISLQSREFFWRMGSMINYLLRVNHVFLLFFLHRHLYLLLVLHLHHHCHHQVVVLFILYPATSASSSTNGSFSILLGSSYQAPTSQWYF